MSGFKRFAGRLAMGAVVAGSLTVGTLALATGTASAAAKHDLSFNVEAHNAVNEGFKVPAGRAQLPITEARLGVDYVFSRIAIMEGNGHVMLGREHPDDSRDRRVGSMSLGDGRL